MKNNTSSVIFTLILIVIVGFVMSPTSTQSRILKSFETLFNLKEGSILRSYETLEINSKNGTKGEKINHSQEAKDYFKEIVLKDEWGNTYKTPFKWKRDIKIFVHGYCPDYMMLELDDIVKDLNDLIGPINLKVVSKKDEANHFIYFGSGSGFKKSYPIINEKNLIKASGYFEIHPKNAYLYVDMIKTENDAKAQRSILREELTQSLGLCNDSWKYPNSMFYQGWSNNTEFSDLDEEIIQMLYNE